MSGLQFEALPYEKGHRWELPEEDLTEGTSAAPRHQDILFIFTLAIPQYLREHSSKCLAFADVEFALPAEGDVVGRNVEAAGQARSSAQAGRRTMQLSCHENGRRYLSCDDAVIRSAFR